MFPPAYAGTGCPAGEAFLSVHLRGTVSRDTTVCLDQVEEWHDLTEPAYRTRSQPGQEPQDEPDPHEALSIRWLITELAGEYGGFSADSITYAEVPNPRSRYVAQLDQHALAESGANGFERGLMPAVFLDPGFGLYYVRPLRPDPSDVNNKDVFPGAENGPLEIYLHTSGQPIRPTISVDAGLSRVGETSSFSVTFDPPTSDPLEYHWTFGDGTNGAERSLAEPEHRWRRAGTYQVYLAVNRSGEPPSQSNLLEVTVRSRHLHPTPPADHEGHEGKGGQHHPHHGPVRGNGGSGGPASPEPDSADGPPRSSAHDSESSDRSGAPLASGPQVAGVLLRTPGQSTGTALDTRSTSVTRSGLTSVRSGTSQRHLALSTGLLLGGALALLLLAGAARESRSMGHRSARPRGMMRP